MRAAPSDSRGRSVWVLQQSPAVGSAPPAFACFRSAVLLLPPRVLPASLVGPAFGGFLDTAGLPLSTLNECPDESTCAVQLLGGYAAVV